MKNLSFIIFLVFFPTQKGYSQQTNYYSELANTISTMTSTELDSVVQSSFNDSSLSPLEVFELGLISIEDEQYENAYNVLNKFSNELNYCDGLLHYGELVYSLDTILFVFSYSFELNGKLMEALIGYNFIIRDLDEEKIKEIARLRAAIISATNFTHKFTVKPKHIKRIVSSPYDYFRSLDTIKYFIEECENVLENEQKYYTNNYEFSPDASLTDAMMSLLDCDRFTRISPENQYKRFKALVYTIDSLILREEFSLAHEVFHYTNEKYQLDTAYHDTILFIGAYLLELNGNLFEALYIYDDLLEYGVIYQFENELTSRIAITSLKIDERFGILIAKKGRLSKPFIRNYDKYISRMSIEELFFSEAAYYLGHLYKNDNLEAAKEYFQLGTTVQSKNGFDIKCRDSLMELE